MSDLDSMMHHFSACNFLLLKKHVDACKVMRRMMGVKPYDMKTTPEQQVLLLILLT